MKRAAVTCLVAMVAAGPLFAGCSDDVAELRWEGGKARFRVELADTPEERGKGLMFRDSMSSGAGMLFVFESPREVAFWMKNTLIPLDMIFIGADGRVGRVHARAVPGDLTPIPGPDETLMVLEIGGGLAARLGLGEGAELRHPALDQSAALWPCEAP